MSKSVNLQFCGEVICGISLLSDSVMQLQHEEYPDRWIHALLSRFSLYIMRFVPTSLMIHNCLTITL